MKQRNRGSGWRTLNVCGDDISPDLLAAGG